MVVEGAGAGAAAGLVRRIPDVGTVGRACLFIVLTGDLQHSERACQTR